MRALMMINSIWITPLIFYQTGNFVSIWIILSSLLGTFQVILYWSRIIQPAITRYHILIPSALLPPSQIWNCSCAKTPHHYLTSLGERYGIDHKSIEFAVKIWCRVLPRRRRFLYSKERHSKLINYWFFLFDDEIWLLIQNTSSVDTSSLQSIHRRHF